MNTYIQLGRFGDILHLIPALYHKYQQTGEKPTIMVAKEFSEAVEACSYLNAIIFDGDFREIHAATQSIKNPKVAQVVGDKQVIAQVYGRNYSVPFYADSFVKDSWRLAGFEMLWRNNLPLIFDKRNHKRESELSSAINPRGLSSVLVFTSGHSSPFKHERLLLQMVETWFPSHLLIHNPVAEKIYDLVGLMEQADCIFSTDSAPLHLAQATCTPVVALATDHPSLWHGSPMRKNHISYSRYSSFPEEIPAINDNLENMYEKNDVIHVFSNYPMSGGSLKRYAQSRSTWSGYLLGLTDSALTRGGNDTPFIKDMLRLACLKAEQDSVIILTNSDTSFYDGARNRIIESVRTHGSCFSYRHDYHGEPRTIGSPEEGVEKYGGCDVFAFTKLWWQEKQNLYPDMQLGREGWDCVMRHLIQMQGGAEVKDAIYHFRHESFWEKNPYDKGNEHNRKLAIRFFRDNRIPLVYPWDRYVTDDLNR